MNIVFLAPKFFPSIGGVEKHALEVGVRVRNKGNTVTVITQRHSKNLKLQEKIKGIEVVRFDSPKIKYLGLLTIWAYMWKNKKVFLDAEIVHIHDVFIWYLPLAVFFPKKKFYITHHGWEGKWPIPKKNIFYKRLANRLSSGNIAVGKYIEKYYGIKTDKIIYGGVDVVADKSVDRKKGILYVGRLEEDTGLPLVLSELQKKSETIGQENMKFVGDGKMRDECRKYGKVHGFVDATHFLQKAKVVYTGGYLTAMEAMVAGCEVRVVWDNDLKKDYWTLAPFYKFIKNKDTNGGYEWVKKQTWEKVAEVYINLWQGK